MFVAYGPMEPKEPEAIVPDAELIELANAALTGRINDPARCALILTRAGAHLRELANRCSNGYWKFIRKILGDADPDANFDD